MKYKLIRGVAHNLGHSFLSDSNAVMREGVYTIVPAVLFAAAKATAVPQVTINLLNEAIAPTELALPELAQAVSFYRNCLPQLLSSHGIDPSVIKGASITIDFDYSRTRRSQFHPADEIQEFLCAVQLTDDRGVAHVANPTEWWNS